MPHYILGQNPANMSATSPFHLPFTDETGFSYGFKGLRAAEDGRATGFRIKRVSDSVSRLVMRMISRVFEFAHTHFFPKNIDINFPYIVYRQLESSSGILEFDGR
jgi:hypothetical protein